jgi:hypothetical protein
MIQEAWRWLMADVNGGAGSDTVPVGPPDLDSAVAQLKTLKTQAIQAGVDSAASNVALVTAQNDFTAKDGLRVAAQQAVDAQKAALKAIIDSY